MFFFFFSSRRRHTRCALVTGVQTCALPIFKNPISDMLAREALTLLAANLATVCDRPDDIEARSAMLLGAHLAGVAFANAPVAGVHALAYPLGEIGRAAGRERVCPYV